MGQRLFIGIGVTHTLRDTLTACHEAFIDGDPSWRGEKWVSAENLHVTLKFLGNENLVAASVAAAVAPAVATLGTYTISLGDARGVPKPRAATLVWVDLVHGARETIELAGRIGESLAALGVAPEARAFKAHVTLCRARKPRRISPEGLDGIARTLFRASDREKRMSVRYAILYASTLTPHGPVYEELVRLPLAE